MISPHPSEIVGLQFKPHGQPVRFDFTTAPLHGLHSLVPAQKSLHMMTHLVGNDISLGEIARRVESPFQFAKELGVEIDLMIFGTIEGACRRLSETTSGLRGVGK